MRLHRFYIEDGRLDDFLEREENFLITNKNLIHQLRSVFRFKEGQEIILFDGSGYDFLCSIAGRENKNQHSKINVAIKNKIPNEKKPKREVTLFQSLVKKDKFELIAEKATEIGVSKIVPLISERSEKKSLNLERARKIIMEAAEQCGRDNIPLISEVVSFSDSLEHSGDIKLAFDPGGRPFHSYKKENENDKSPISIFIGPEGGWTEKEMQLFKKKGVEIISLGENILRAETAAVVACSFLLL